MPFLQNAQNVHINNSDLTDIKGDYVENVVVTRRGRGRSDNRMTTEIGGNYHDISKYSSTLPIHNELMNDVIQICLNGNVRPPRTSQDSQATSSDGNNMDSRHMPRTYRNDTNDDLYNGNSHVPPAGERHNGGFESFMWTDTGHNGQGVTSNVNSSDSIDFTRRVSFSGPEGQSSSPNPTGAQIDFMKGGENGDVPSINNLTLGRSNQIATTSHHAQVPDFQLSPTGRHEDSDELFTSTSRERKPVSYTRAEGGVTRGFMASGSSDHRATLDGMTSPQQDTSIFSTNAPRPEVSINEALKKPPPKKEAGFLGF